MSAIIPTWNRADLLSSILQNLKELTRSLDEIIVVDNGSTDSSPVVAQAAGAKLVAFRENRGFAVAVNEGVRQASGDWILIVNNDVCLRANWLARVLMAVQKSGASFAAGKLLRHEDKQLLDGSWDLLSRGAYALRCGYSKADGAVWSEQKAISFAPMTAALFHRDVFRQVGYLDERFESYYEDVDFGLRCAQAGIKGVYVPDAIAFHSSKTTLGARGSRVYFLSSRNQVFLLAKHYSSALLRKLIWPILVGQTLSILAAARQGHLLAALRGKWAALRLWRSMRSGVNQPTPLHNADSVGEIVRRSEDEIRSLQQTVGFDPYWRLYFGLVRSS